MKWLLIGSPYPVIVYSDHQALADIFRKGDSEKARINTWLDRLSEFDLIVRHRPFRDQHIELADGLSRMPTRYLSPPVMDDIPERMSMANIPIQIESKPVQIWSTPIDERYQKYCESPMYRNLVEYLRWGPPALEGMNPNQRRQLVRKSQRYTLSDLTDIPMLHY